MSGKDQEVAKDCPDYEEALKALLAKHKRKADVPEDDVSEAVMDLMAESFSEPEPEDDVESDESAEDNRDDDDGDVDDSENGDRIEQAEQKLRGLQATLLETKQKLMDLDSDVEALELQQKQEVEAITAQWTGTKTELNRHLKGPKTELKKALKALKDSQKAKKKTLRAEIKALENAIPDAEYELKVLTTRGKIELILYDPDLIGTLKERWIAAEVAKRLDYPIFMAVSERGGKNNSGNYEYVIDDDGSLVEFPEGHPQEGQLAIDQDLVNFHLSPDDLADPSLLSPDEMCIAEAFVPFAQEQSLSFWEVT